MKIKLLAVILILTTQGFSQSEPLQILHQFDNESLKVRWITSDLEIIAQGIQGGYELTLSRMDNGNTTTVSRQEITPKSHNQLSNGLSQPSDSLVFEIFRQLKVDSFEAADENHHQWQLLGFLFGVQENFSLAKDIGLGYEVTDLDTTAVYELNLSIPASGQEKSFSFSKSNISYKNPILPIPSPLQWTCADNKITLTSNVAITSESYGSYRIDRKTTDGTTSTVNSLPLLPNYDADDPLISVIDTIDEDAIFSYCIVGKDIWGKWGPPSDAVEIEPCHVSFLPPHPVTCQEVVERGKIYLEWSIPDSLEIYLEGFSIERSDERFGNFERIGPGNLVDIGQRSFTDLDPLPVGFYRVTAFYRNNIQRPTATKMVALIDTRPPPIPDNITTSFDTSQFTVTLEWAAISTNDFRGYRIYFSPTLTGEKFLLKNIDIKDNFFVDTIAKGTLQTQRYYWITSRDIHQNESFYSDSVFIFFPDRFPPVPPRISEISYNIGTVTLIWEPSPSRDVKKYLLQRKSKASNADWEKIDIQPTGRKNIYVDSLLSAVDTIMYRIQVIDSSDLFSYSKIRTAVSLSPIYLPAVEYFVIEKNDSNPTLYFDYSEGHQIERFRLLAGTDQSQIKTVQYIDPALAATRKNIRKKDKNNSYVLYKWELSNTNYKYFQLQAIRQDGKPSLLTPIMQQQ